MIPVEGLVPEVRDAFVQLPSTQRMIDAGDVPAGVDLRLGTDNSLRLRFVTEGEKLCGLLVCDVSNLDALFIPSFLRQARRELAEYAATGEREGSGHVPEAPDKAVFADREPS